MQGPHVHEWLPTGKTLTYVTLKDIEFYCLDCRTVRTIQFRIEE